MSPPGKPGSHRPAQLMLVYAPLTQSLWKGRLISAFGENPMPSPTSFSWHIISEPASSQAVSASLLPAKQPRAWLTSTLSIFPSNPSHAPPSVPHCGDIRGSCHQTQHIALVHSQIIPTVLTTIMQGLHTHKNWFELFLSSPPVPFWHFQIYSSHYRSVWDSSYL